MRKRRPPKRRAPKAQRASFVVETLDAEGVGRVGDLRLPFALPGEEVEALVVGKQGRVVARKADAAVRHKPICRHFGRPGDGCGGCALQHLGGDTALEVKSQRLLSAVHRVFPNATIDAVYLSPQHSRRRSLFAVQPDRAGFRALGEKSIVPLTECFILRPELLEELQPLRRLAGQMGMPFDAQLTLTTSGIDASLFALDEEKLDLRQRELIAAFTEERDYARLSVGGTVLAARREPVVEFGGIPTALPSGAFLQATEEGQAALTKEVLKACQGAKRMVDLFAGLGTFAIPMSEQGEVAAYDSAGDAIAALDVAARKGGRSMRAEARDLFKRPLMASEFKSIDAVVFDPPRAGAGLQARELASAEVPTVVAVSCNPASLAKDLQPFAEAYALDRLALVDQFGWSAHIETVAVLRRR